MYIHFTHIHNFFSYKERGEQRGEQTAMIYTHQPTHIHTPYIAAVIYLLDIETAVQERMPFSISWDWADMCDPWTVQDPQLQTGHSLAAEIEAGYYPVVVVFGVSVVQMQLYASWS